jgi:hypothetical protein
MLPDDVTEITRETYEPIGSVEYVLFYYLVAVTLAIFFFGVYRRFSRYTRGTEDGISRTDGLLHRIIDSAKIVVSNDKLFDRDLYGGLMHAFVIWGFLTLFIATSILAVDQYVVKLLFNESFWYGDFYLAYQFIVDAFGLLFIVGIGMVLYRRYWIRNSRLWDRHTSLEDDAFVWMLFFLGIGGFLLEGIRILVNGYPPYEVVSFVKR